MARHAKPVALKKLAGQYRRDKLTANAGRKGKGPIRAELTLPPGCPPCPEYLSDRAKERWAIIVPELHSKGVLAMVDASTVEGYCTSYANAVAFDIMANANPEVEVWSYKAKGKRVKTKKINPAFDQARKCWGLSNRLASELGITPAARSRVAMPDRVPEADDFLFAPLEVLPGGKKP